ncbi:MAG: LPP20 family lipoprotein [Nitrospiraceae bacterium]
MHRISVGVLVGVLMLLAASQGCGWSGRSAGPRWINGSSQDYPADLYLLGVGQADSQPVAAERAYGAVAKIFKAEVAAQSREWESFLVMERRGQPNTERRLTLDHITKVSTDKVLENISIIDTWHDRKSGQYYALAGTNRAQAATALVEQIAELDRAVETEVGESRQTQDKLAKVRNLRRAVKNLIVRDAYNGDLRVVRPSGRGIDPAYRVPELTAELEQFLAASLMVGVEVIGEQSELTRQAVIEGLIREGLPVTNRTMGEQNGLDEPAAGPLPQLLVKGAVRLWDVPVPDPRFRYVRWCSDFVIIEIDTERLVGAVSIGGKEGHVTPLEARAKAVRIMQQELASSLSKTLAGYVYGETDPPASLPPSACPMRDETVIPSPAIRPL